MVPLSGQANDHDGVVRAAAGSRFVLLGENTHGTREYYVERGRISERLIREAGFGAVAIEGDWSATYRVNQYVRGLGSDRSAEQALSGYQGFPRWMWRNAEFRDFIDRLRTWNLGQPAERRAGVYGMDVYDVFDAADAVIGYLGSVDPRAAATARRQYACFAPYRRSTHAYGEAARRASRSCEEEVQAVIGLVEGLPTPTGPVQRERHFAARRSAASVAGGEAYFRTVYAGSLAWNVRDQHMARNVEEIANHVGALSGRPGKVVVWSHNTHSGDARATFAADRGELNLGQLMRQRYRDAAFLVGFFTYTGTVMAAPEWDAPGRVYQLRPALPESYSGLFHRAGVSNFSMMLRGNASAAEFGRDRLERAVGVIYLPQSERQSHYFDARLTEQFDSIIYFDRTNAVSPLR
ncbi:MAG TPA: erythromycin esterase family protein [Allosphingosinicella sp.]|uniref:erythromycin esterase family protein n=1 Tax=Allosphingosinicella sp. TaxID=2823234 RepID=UPI002F29ADC6